MSRRTAALYAVLMIANATIAALVGQIVAGQVPIPPQYLWLVPILLPPMQLGAMFLPSALEPAAVASVRGALTPELILEAAAAAERAGR